MQDILQKPLEHISGIGLLQKSAWTFRTRNTNIAGDCTILCQNQMD